VISSDPAPGGRIRNTGTVTLTVSLGPEIVEVPDLAGRTPAEARRELKKHGLDPGLVSRTFDEDTPRGSVVRTEPAAGTERRPGTAVELVLSKGREIAVPDVSGQDEETARETLRGAGLKVAVAGERLHSSHEKGTVARQSPSAGGVAAAGDTVRLVLSKGPEPVRVPDVEDLSAQAAREALEAAGFTVEVRKVFFGDTVFNQSPDAGEEAPRGSEVVLWVR
jgi:beta-lactam-binding protein with PASTA domain